MKTPKFRAIPQFACAAFLTLFIVSAPAEIVRQIQPVDTTLRENQPANNFGASENLPVGISSDGLTRNRALLAFDLGFLPADTVLNSVKLKVPVVQAGPNSPATTFELRRVLVSWNEGKKSGIAAATGESTWNSRFHNQLNWTAPGGLAGVDFSSTVSATATLLSAGSVTEFNSPGIIADVYSWKTNSAANFGWMLLAQGEPAGSGKQIGSSQNPTNRPVLEVRFSSFSIYDFFKTGTNLRFSFDAVSNQTYAVEWRDNVSTGSWTTLTSIAASPVDRTIHVTNAITPQPRFYRLRKP
jgi:hypothetical protein